MNRLFALSIAVVAAGAMIAVDADARRLSGGRNLGVQRSAPAPAQPATPPSAAPSKASPTGPAADPVMPRQGAAGAPAGATQPGVAAKAAPGAAAAPAKSGMSRWLGPVAGLAAGLGLAALAAHLGIAEELLSLMLLVLVALVAFALIRAFVARRSSARPAMQYAGGPMGATTTPRGYETQAPPAVETGRLETVPLASRPRWPAGFDAERFAEQAKLQFRRLQVAYDAGDRAALADVTTPTMFTELTREMPEGSVAAHPTEIVAVNAEVLEVASEGDRHWASVRFRGLTREHGEPMPKPFDEVWNLVKPADGSSGWLLAGIRQLDAAHA